MNIKDLRILTESERQALVDMDLVHLVYSIEVFSPEGDNIATHFAVATPAATQSMAPTTQAKPQPKKKRNRIRRYTGYRGGDSLITIDRKTWPKNKHSERQKLVWGYLFERTIRGDKPVSRDYLIDAICNAPKSFGWTEAPSTKQAFDVIKALYNSRMIRYLTDKETST